jgi:hypothetical protein
MSTTGMTVAEANELTTMEDQVYKIKNAMISFLGDAEKVDNKSAARRARKLSMEITRMLKDYRAASIK